MKNFATGAALILSAGLYAGSGMVPPVAAAQDSLSAGVCQYLLSFMTPPQLGRTTRQSHLKKCDATRARTIGMRASQPFTAYL